MNLLVAVLATVGLAAAVTRFLRQSTVTEGLRQRLSAYSPLLEKLFSCPHCLCFWTALACAALLARGWLVFAVLVLLGWRGAYYLNRLLDVLNERAGTHRRSQPEQRHCQVCSTPWNRDFLERGGRHFCSYRCWFDYLKELRQETRQHESPLFDDSGVFVRRELCPGRYQEIDPNRARELLAGGSEHVYLDVRTPLEFANGHPAGAVNVPLYHRQTDHLAPNRDFLRVVEAHFPRTTRFLVGCQMGARSRRATEALLGAGYPEVAHVQGGFSGARDLAGRKVARGWFALGLPVEYGAAAGQSYESLVESMEKTHREGASWPTKNT